MIKRSLGKIKSCFGSNEDLPLRSDDCYTVHTVIVTFMPTYINFIRKDCPRIMLTWQLHGSAYVDEFHSETEKNELQTPYSVMATSWDCEPPLMFLPTYTNFIRRHSQSFKIMLTRRQRIHLSVHVSKCKDLPSRELHDDCSKTAKPKVREKQTASSLQS